MANKTFRHVYVISWADTNLHKPVLTETTP